MKLVKLIGIILVLAGCSATSKGPDKPDGLTMLEQNMKALGAQSAHADEGTIKLATETEALVEELKKGAPDPQKPAFAHIAKKVSEGKQSLINKKAEMAKAHFSDGAAVINNLKPKK